MKNTKTHGMNTRHEAKYKFQFANTDRLKKDIRYYRIIFEPRNKHGVVSLLAALVLQGSSTLPVSTL